MTKASHGPDGADKTHCFRAGTHVDGAGMDFREEEGVGRKGAAIAITY